MKKIIWGLLFLIFLSTNVAFGIEEKTTIRVGISNSGFSTFEHSKVTLILPEAANIVDMTEGEKKEISPNSSLEIEFAQENFTVKINGKTEIKKGKGPLVISSAGKIGIQDLKRKGNPAYYRGMIELKAAKPDKFNIVNVLDMQSYLKGVVPNEMPVSFGLEALKAQAVAARTYANRSFSYKNYDVCDSTACQVYYGANSETQISDSAVDATKGVYALYNGEPILTLYSSTPGGITEDYFLTHGNFSVNKPYLTSVKDSDSLDKINDEDYFKKAPPSFDMKSPRYRWKKTFTRGELEEILSKTLIEQSNGGCVTPAFEEGKIEGLSDIKILKKGKSRKALEVEIKSKTGDFIVKKELPIRRVFKSGYQILPSANFIVEKNYDKAEISDNTKKEAEEKNEEGIFDLKETLEKKLANKKLPTGFTFYGAGFGHGIGMSQYGAGYLSGYGVGYEEILKHYYKGITLGTIPKTVSYNDFGLNYTQEFYFSSKNKPKASQVLSQSPLKKEISALLNTNKKNCYLVIDNAQKVSDIGFYINGYYFSQNLKEHSKRFLKTDITRFLQEGENKITFLPLNAQDKKKSLKFYLVFGENGNE